MHIAESYIGGVRRFLLDALPGLAGRGFQVHLVLSPRRAPKLAEADAAALQAAGVECSIVPMKRNISPSADRRALRQIAGIIDAWQPDIVHAHSSKAGFLARYAGRRLCAHRPRLIYSPHAFAFQGRFSAPRRRLYLALERLAAPWTDAFAFVSRAELRAALAAGLLGPGRAAYVVPLGVDLGRFRPRRPEELRTRDVLGLPHGQLIGCLADFRPQKGHAVLLSALAMLPPPSMPHLLLIGDGPLRLALEAAARRIGLSARVHFLGRRDDVHEILPHLDLFVLPSLWEGMPYALLEAMACGCPVLAADVGGVPEVVTAAGCGLLFQTGRPASLAAALRVLLTRPRDLERMGKAGAGYVRKRHSLEQMLTRLSRIYRQIVDNLPQPDRD